MPRTKDGRSKEFRTQTEIALDDYSELIASKGSLPPYFPYVFDDCRSEDDWETFMQGPPSEDRTAWTNRRDKNNSQRKSTEKDVGRWVKHKRNSWTILLRNSYRSQIISPKEGEVHNIIIERKDKDWNWRCGPEGLLPTSPSTKSTNETWKRKQEALYAMTPENDAGETYDPHETWSKVESEKTYSKREPLVIKLDSEANHKLNTLSKIMNQSVNNIALQILKPQMDALWDMQEATRFHHSGDDQEVIDLRNKVKQYKDILSKLTDL